MTMREFLQGWRRKLGAVTLVLACVLLVGWVRSYSYVDDITIRDASFICTSASGEFFWSWRYRYDEKEFAVEWLANHVSRFTPDYFVDKHRYNEHVPYWSFVFPLTAISAYLLLGNPFTPWFRQEPLKEI